MVVAAISAERPARAGSPGQSARARPAVSATDSAPNAGPTIRPANSLTPVTRQTRLMIQNSIGGLWL